MMDGNHWVLKDEIWRENIGCECIGIPTSFFSKYIKTQRSTSSEAQLIYSICPLAHFMHIQLHH